MINKLTDKILVRIKDLEGQIILNHNNPYKNQDSKLFFYIQGRDWEMKQEIEFLKELLG